MWRDENLIVFNGPDEQFVSGLAAGACGGIGGTYAVMPELFLKAREQFLSGHVETARQIQNEICRIIYSVFAAHGNLYSVLKAVLKKFGTDVGAARKPLPGLTAGDAAIVDSCAKQIEAAIARFCR